MPFLIIGIVIAAIIFWYLSGERALSRNEKLYLKRRGYATDERGEMQRPVRRDTRLLGLIDSLSDVSSYGRQRAAEEISALCRSGQTDERMYSALVSALEDNQPSVRSAVARALGDFGDRRAIEILSKRLESEEAIQTIAAIKQAIEKLDANHHPPQIDSP